jgi:hypothetical protein
MAISATNEVGKMNKIYLKQVEIDNAKAELAQVREDLEVAHTRLDQYRGMSEDHKECSRLRDEQIRIVDLIDNLKDCGRDVV